MLTIPFVMYGYIAIYIDICMCVYMHKPTSIIIPRVTLYRTVQSIDERSITFCLSLSLSPLFAWTPDPTAQKTAEKARVPARLDSNPKDAPFLVKKKI
jgi:hypothetical protein